MVEVGLAVVGAVPRGAEGAGPKRGATPSVGIVKEDAPAAPLPRREGEDEGLAVMSAPDAAWPKVISAMAPCWEGQPTPRRR